MRGRPSGRRVGHPAGGLPPLMRAAAVGAAGRAGAVQRLAVTPLTPASFAPFGQVVRAIDDHVEFGPDAAQLELSRGTPRFYIMRLPGRGLAFSQITHHKECTQCLGALGQEPWYMAVAPPGTTPGADTLRAFEVPPGTFLCAPCGAAGRRRAAA